MNNVWGMFVWNFEPNQLSRGRVSPKTPLLYLRFNIADQTQEVYQVLEDREGRW